jgi:ribosomal-protein-alanine N-acetyltransferase
MSAIPEPLAVRFRAMNYADLNSVMLIEKQAYPFPWTTTIFRDCIRVGYRCRLLEINGTIEAYGILAVAANEAHVLNLCVRPASQNQGLARHMLGHLLDIARINVAQTIFLEVRPSNHSAINLYQSVGFCEIGLRHDYYPNFQGREDALVMGMSL